MKPGEYILAKEPIFCNNNRFKIIIMVANTGDRPVQVGSHYHFFEVNRALKFDRNKAFGMRLNIPAGTAMRFEPGEEKEITLVAIAGLKNIHGLNDLTGGSVEPEGKQKIKSLKKAKDMGFEEIKESDTGEKGVG
ncbi:hypothetical protein HY02_06905 [Peptococcaceae bacterium SCADC1_2_3]|jgi:urease beta subunit|nr:hypothetical protein DK28_0212960 [Peptococcaceae bacterium SCADC1_2_3]KFI37441.1 hypothetical protein HY02_06905 [Peptococcaceae bacterium SCADC1_2_3]